MGRKHYLKIVVYLIGTLGDTIIAIPALKALRRHFGKDAQIYILHDVQPNFRITPAHLLGNSTLVDGFIAYPFDTLALRRIRSLLCLWQKVCSAGFDAVVYLAPSGRRASAVKRDRLFFTLCMIPKKIGFHIFDPAFLYPPGALRGSDTVTHEAILRLERLRLDGIDVSYEKNLSGGAILEISSSDSEYVREWLTQRRMYPARHLVALSPGSAMSVKEWPIERFIEIGHRLIAQNMFELVVVGGMEERKIGQRLIREWGKGINAAGCFSVRQAAALFSCCVMNVGVDSGATHLAAAVGVPCVAIYSQRDYPGRWYPLGNNHIIVTHPVVCRGCFSKVCPLKTHLCMQEISVDDVWQAITNLINTLGLAV